MMSSLFTVFDPSSSYFNVNWVSLILGLFCMPCVYWAIASRWVYVWNFLTLSLFKEFNVLLGLGQSGFGFFFVCVFSFILYNNFLGLFPYVFTSTSHFVVTLSLALPLWLVLMIYGWLCHTSHMLVHLVPQGTPGVLMPFMVLIETISNMIRPGALAVRLAANMTAGHLLLTLLGSVGFSVSGVVLLLLLVGQGLLLVLECAVAVIQSYVFTVLGVLYASEIN